jgi:isopropylmalate/homocitrate/citramalate synthase
VLSKRANDSRISALFERVEKLEDERSGDSLTADRVAEIAREEIEQALPPITDQLEVI